MAPEVVAGLSMADAREQSEKSEGSGPVEFGEEEEETAASVAAIGGRTTLLLSFDEEEAEEKEFM
jgi:hypothetical protein